MLIAHYFVWEWKMTTDNPKNANNYWRILSNLFRATHRISHRNQCDSCVQNKLTTSGRRVILFGKLNLNAATDDFVIFGYLQFIGRLLCLVLLGIVISLELEVKSTEMEISNYDWILYLTSWLAGV